jgi:hypothetical protein
MRLRGIVGRVSKWRQLFAFKCTVDAWVILVFAVNESQKNNVKIMSLMLELEKILLIQLRPWLVATVLACIVFNAGCAARNPSTTSGSKSGDTKPTLIAHAVLWDESSTDACGSESQTKKGQPTYVPAGEYALPIASVVRGAADEFGTGSTGKLRAFQLYANALAAKLDADEQFYNAMQACEEKGDCKETAINKYFQEVSVSADPVALIGASSRDADIYAAAFYQCQEKKTDACSAISSNNWAALDPDNAVPLIYAAAEAKIRNDDVALDKYLKNASERAAFNSRVPDLSLILYAQNVRSKDTVTRITLSNTLANEYQMLQGVKYLGFHQYCISDFMNTQSRSVSCEKIADLIISRAKDLDDLGFALAVGEKVNWPVERTQKLTGELKLLRQLIEYNSPRLNMVNCEGFYAQRKLITNLYKNGELATFRALLIERKSGFEK